MSAQKTLFGDCAGESIWQPSSYWAAMDDATLNEYVNRIFRHYRQVGYPHQDQRANADVVFHSFREAAGRLAAVTPGGDLRFHMHALGLCWSFHRHAIAVKCNGHRSVAEAFSDDEFLKKTIRKCLKRSGSMNDNHFRETIRNMAGTQKPSNFRPMAAASVYRTIAAAAGRAVEAWDMCGGFGGRMLGAAASESVSKYHCNEPCAATRSGLTEAAAAITDFAPWCSITIDGRPAEESPTGSWDVCFTSPPYWDTERYSEEPTQSCVRYKTYSEWLDGFLRRTVEIAVAGLRGDGLLVLNVAATKRCKALPEDTVSVCRGSGMTLIRRWRYLLGATTKGGMKHEPVFVFAKKAAGWHHTLPGERLSEKQEVAA